MGQWCEWICGYRWMDGSSTGQINLTSSGVIHQTVKTSIGLYSCRHKILHNTILIYCPTLLLGPVSSHVNLLCVCDITHNKSRFTPAQRVHVVFKLSATIFYFTTQTTTKLSSQLVRSLFTSSCTKDHVRPSIRCNTDIF